MSSEIEEIKDKLDIVDYVGKVVQLKKTGANYKGLCPFHNEKTPSFIVSPDKQIFHCFGCNEGGDIFAFVMKSEGMEFVEALKKLAADAGVTLAKKFDAGASDKREKLFEINEKACDYFEKYLRDPSGKLALDYLKKRKLTDKTIKEFRLGYAKNEQDGLIRILKKEGYGEKEMIAAGVAKERNGRIIDQFRGRVTFPIINPGGRVVGFSARVLDDGLPKYINTATTEIYDKSNILYGIYQAKERIRKQDHAIIVEGNMDVIASHQAGVKNVVASSGTALTERQLDILKKFSPNIKLAFDVDPAGNMATRRAIEMALQKGINVKIIEIPEGKDPADVVAKDPKIWIDASKKAVHVMDFLLEKLFTPEILSDIIKKKKATREYITFIAQLEDFVEKDHYIKKLAGKIKVDEDFIRKSLGKQPQKKAEAIQDRPEKPALRDQIENRLVGISLSNGKNLDFLFGYLEEEDFDNPTTLNLYKKAKKHYTSKKSFDLKKFRKLENYQEQHYLDILLLRAEQETKDLGEEEAAEEIFYLAKKIKALNIRRAREELSKELKEAENRKDDKWAKTLVKRMQELIKKEQKI